eukprot:c46586_g1_i1.p1 GENE.c46586_g1_i1~~c46586_g1_i1.p1  ORF type:complete len:267 (+),score=43.66 c46586_g1_i1:30-803(+)
MAGTSEDVYIAALTTELQTLQNAGLHVTLPNTFRLVQTEITAMSARNAALASTMVPITQSVMAPQTTTTTTAGIRSETSVSDGKLVRKLFVPLQLDPNYNYVGRLLGPKGLTMKAVENASGAKVLVRGQGSMREDKRKISNCKFGAECSRRASCPYLHPGQSEDDLQDSAAKLLAHLKEPLHVLVMAPNTPVGHECVRAAEIRILPLLMPDYTSNSQSPPAYAMPIQQTAWLTQPMYGAAPPAYHPQSAHDQRYQPY